MALIIQAPKPVMRLASAIQRQLNVVFFGTPLFAVPTLRLLHAEGWPIRAVVTSPDKPIGRRMLLTPSPVKSAADELNIEVFTPTSLKDDDFFSLFDALRPDICVVVAYGKLIPERYLRVPRLGFLNVHPSLLPLYRGPSPIQSALLDGRETTGVSIMLLDAEMDHGPVLSSVPWDIPSGFHAALCEDELARVGARLLVDTLKEYSEGIIQPHEQSHEAATYCQKYQRNDGKLDWTQPSEMVVNRIRALSSNPGAWTTWNGKVLNIRHAHRIDTPLPAAPAGTVHLLGNELVVSCGTGGIALEVIQLEGSTQQNARDFLNGHAALVDGIVGT